MAFKGIDFAKLSAEMDARRAMSPQDRAMLEAREDFARNARAVAQDEAARSAASPTHKVITLTEHAYRRFDIGGGSVTTMRFISDDGQAMSAVYRQSEAERLTENAQRDPGIKWQQVGRLEPGSQVSVLGEETTRRWRDLGGSWRSAKEFTASRLEPGVHSREDLIAMAMTPMVKAALAHDSAKDEPARQMIAREFLGQPAVSPEAVSAAKGATAAPQFEMSEPYRGR